MKGLSLIQPWASLIAAGGKRIETRSWSASYRGPIAIHASLRIPWNARDWYFDSEAGRLAQAALGQYGKLDVPLGAIVAVAELIDCLPTQANYDRGYGSSATVNPDFGYLSEQELAFGDFSYGRFGWLLANVRALPEPVLCRGARMLWEVPADVVEAIERQLGVRDASHAD